MFHRFTEDVSGVVPPERFNNPYHYTPHPLCVIAANEVRRFVQADDVLRDEVSLGKMFGVLVVSAADGHLGYLAAYSGLLRGSNSYPGFVPAVYDMMSSDGYFKREENSISEITRQIRIIENDAGCLSARRALDNCKEAAERELAAMRDAMRDAKACRDARRALGGLSHEENNMLLRDSMFAKAEFKRRTREWQGRISQCEAAVSEYVERVEALKTERATRSSALQEWLFRQFVMLNANGEFKNLMDIFNDYRGCMPPAGAGECAAPKLLQWAYCNGLRPLCMAEFWMGESPSGELRRDGCFYGSCKGKCEPILDFMLRGLQVDESPLATMAGCTHDIPVVYEDEYLVVVDKPAGVLSVPGVVGGVSVQEWLCRRCGNNDVRVVHRLDMATSGLLVAAKSLSVYKAMQAEFASRNVVKRYIALLEGVPACKEGTVSLPLLPDYDNRPRMMVDAERGKHAVSGYEVVGIVRYKGAQRAVVMLTPYTGRTHQLRVHCAHRLGLDTPIVGDELYGTHDERLFLHACALEFVHPVTGRMVSLVSEFHAIRTLADGETG